MGRAERRNRTALDEAYRYYLSLENGEKPELYRLNKAVSTLSFALSFSELSEFKLTKQLWKRLHQALFDRLITNFSGRISARDAEWRELETGIALPSMGHLEFFPENCRRADDGNEIEFRQLYPKTFSTIKRIWESRKTTTNPSDFSGADCENGVCLMKPILLGREVLNEESSEGRREAQQKWWELYWQTYCSNNRKEKDILTRQMSYLESIWGNLS